jgi:hypothetical protein
MHLELVEQPTFAAHQLEERLLVVLPAAPCGRVAPPPGAAPIVIIAACGFDSRKAGPAAVRPTSGTLPNGFWQTITVLRRLMA